MIVAGCSAGLSILAKFNGVLAILSPGRLDGPGALCSRTADRPRRLALSAGLGGAIVAAVGTFVVFNPFMTAHPGGPLPADMQAIAEMGIGDRFLFLVDHRREVSRGQQRMFPHNAIQTWAERARVVAVQGFGRFGPLGPRKSDSTVRYDLAQDWGALVWLPLVAAGLVWSIVMGRRQLAEGEPPAAWALALWACLALAAVVGYLPMAWDRYELPIQAPAALLAALPLASVWLAFRETPHPSRLEDLMRSPWIRLQFSVFLILLWQLRVLLALPRLEHRQPPDPDLCARRPGHGLPGRARSADRRHRFLSGSLLLRQAPRVLAGGDGSVQAGPDGSGPSTSPAPSALSAQGRSDRLLAGRLLDDAGYLGAVHGLHRGAALAAGTRPGLLAACGRSRGSGLRPGHAGLRLCDTCLWPPALGVRPAGLVLPDLETAAPVANSSAW